MNTHTLVGLGIAETLAPGEPSKQIGQKTKLYAITDTAENLADKTFGSSDCYVKGSKDLKQLSGITTKAIVSLFGFKFKRYIDWNILLDNNV